MQEWDVLRFLFTCRNPVRKIEKRLVPDVSPYKDDKKIAVFSWSSQTLFAKEIVTIILGKYDNEVLCTWPPINVSHNVIFLVDTRKLCKPNHLKCDDIGAWGNNGVRKKRVFVKFDYHNDTATVDLSTDPEDHHLYF